MRSRFLEVGWNILDIIVPPQCGGCQRWGERWCPTCQGSIHIIDGKICKRCGQPLYHQDTALCDRCQLGWNYFYRLRSWAYYEGPIQNAIQALKYEKNIGLASRLAKYLTQFLRSLTWNVEIIIPVPLGIGRLRERGYNQALLLAKPIAWSTHIPLRPQGLKRIRDTSSQVGLTRKQRLENVQNAFAADQGIVGGRNVLVIDDVVTTGATMNACAWALKQDSAAKVFALSLARSFQIAQQGLIT